MKLNSTQLSSDFQNPFVLVPLLLLAFLVPGLGKGSGALKGNESSRTTLEKEAPPPESGREQFNYNLHCLGCHGMEGMGLTDVPPFPGVLGYFLHDPEGRRFIIQVPGVSHSDLNNREIAQLTNWILKKYAREELPKDYKEFSEEEVTRYRTNPLIDVDTERRKVLKLLKAKNIPIPDP